MAKRTVSTKSSVVRRTTPRPLSAPIRYAVVGLGHLAQAAILPAFAHAKKNSELTALVSDDPKKLQRLAARYDVPYTYTYREFDHCLLDGSIDAVYLALPNHLHCDFAVRAATAGIHVLCEKPMALTEQECRRMIQAAERADVKLMVAYRLHFEEANMNAAELAQSGKLGKLRLFHSLFSMQVQEDNIRIKAELGGGSLYDIGIYCINAARYIFRANPTKVSAFTIQGTDRRFREVDEMTAAHLHFPDHRLATFVCSFGATDLSMYEVVGTKGRVKLDPAYEYVGALEQTVTIHGKRRHHRYKEGDQFSPELLYFSDCILKDVEPEPSGLEGLIDVAIVQALYRSGRINRPVALSLPEKQTWPSVRQVVHRPPVRPSSLVHVKAPAQ